MEIKETGYLALLAGVVIAIIVGILELLGVTGLSAGSWLVILALIGLVAGILSLAIKDTVVFLIVTLLLVITGQTLASTLAGLATILNNIVIVAAVAGFVVVLKAVYALSFK